jgi:hypothetical protein
MRAEQFLPGSEGVGGGEGGGGGKQKEGAKGRGGEMTQTLYAHMNK